jgi:hypothetical protein
MSVTASIEPPVPPGRAIALIGITLALGYIVVLGAALYAGQWLIDGQSRPIADDFVNVWAAGQLALDGHAALAYDWTAHKAGEVAAVGHAFDNYYGWHYPPTFLFVAVALALLPFVPAAVLWLAVTLPLYAAAIRAITGSRAGIFLAVGFPATLWNIAAGQNGFLTAALIGGTLTLIERWPALAGICLGLLSYKPHFGLLFPLALIAAREWRVIGFAAATAAAMIVLSWLVFGGDAWAAFVNWMPATNQAVLGEGRADFDRLQSLFGLIRAHGGNATLAWIVQAVVASALAAALFRLWRSEAEFALKAAALAAGALIATPYLYMYDLVVLAVPVAYLVRIGLRRGFSHAELLGLPVAGLLLLIYPYLKTQVGFAAALIVAGLVMARILRDRSRLAAS